MASFLCSTENLDMPEPQEIPADTREGNPEEPTAEEATLLTKVDLGGFLTGIASSVQSTVSAVQVC